MINLDPSIIDQDSVRKKRRKHLLKLAIAPIIILAIFALYFSRPLIYNGIFSLSYQSGSWGAARGVSKVLSWMNPFEVYIPPFNEGVTLMQEKNYAEAEKMFHTSRESNPPQSAICKIDINLSLSIEYQADILADSDDYEDAIIAYHRADSFLTADKCTTPERPEAKSEGEKAIAAQERIQEKLKKALSEMASEAGDGDGTTTGPKEADKSTLDDVIREQNNASSAIQNDIYRMRANKNPSHYGLDVRRW